MMIPGLDGCIVHLPPQPGTYAYRTYIGDTANATTYSGGSWNSISIGDADPNRYVLVGIYGSSGTPRTVSSVTIGGVSATLVSDGTNSARIQHSNGTSEFWIAAVPTGTTANISITWSGSQGRCGAGVWTMVRPKSTTAVDVDSSNSASPASVTLTTTNPGVVFAIGGNNSTGSYSWTNVTERYDSVIENANSGADAATTGSSLAVTATFTGSPVIRTLLCVAFDLGDPASGSVSRLLDSYSNVTGAWSMSRTLLSSYAGSALYTTATGVDSLKDQTGNSRHFEQATTSKQPAVVVAGPNNRTAFRSPIDSLKFLSGAATSALISATTGYIVVCCIQNEGSSDYGRAVFGNSDPEGTDFDTIGFRLGDFEGGWWARNDDLSVDEISFVESENVVGRVVVCEWMHESGQLKARLNGGSWQSTPSGNTQGTSQSVTLGASGRIVGPDGEGGYILGGRLVGDVFEMVTFNAIPTEGQRDALVANMLQRYANL